MPTDTWLSEVLDQAIRDGWCLKMNCTTCGSPEMRALLTGDGESKGTLISFERLSEARAVEVIEGLRKCVNPSQREAIMWLLYGIWLRFGDRAHDSLFPRLSGTFAGRVLDEMRAHYAADLEHQRKHLARQGVKQRDWTV